MSAFGGLENGLKKGLQYSVDVARLTEWALERGKMELLGECVQVGVVFAKEMADEAGQVTSHAVELAVTFAIAPNFSHDPNAGSRHLAQAALAKGRNMGFK